MESGPKNILLLEDDESISKLILFKLKKSGFKVRHFQNPVGVIESIFEDRPDLIISDIMMPIKDGLELLKEIKAAPELKEIPVILLTSLGHEEAVLKGLEAGAIDYIVKPFSSAELIVRIKKALM